MTDSATQTRQILLELERGNPAAAARFEPLAYHELHALAERQLRGERSGHTLQPTALVHEAWLKLLGQTPVAGIARAQLLAQAAAAMRRVLIDHARRRGADKRGGPAQRITLHDDAAASTGPDLDVLALHEALERLAGLDPRQAQIVELRFFGGLTGDETADVLGLSRRTVEGDWHMARAWLRRELGGGGASR